MSAILSELAGLLPVAGHRPWPRHVVDLEAWSAVGRALREGAADLLSLWGYEGNIWPALRAGAHPTPLVVSIGVRNGTYPAVGRHHPAALRLERAIRDLHGFEPAELPDARPWLDHGTWGLRAPLGVREPCEIRDPADYAFLPVHGAGLHEIPVGPVHAGIIEPGHFRFTANGEIVVRLEQRLGYVHKGIESLMVGADLERGAPLAGRNSGASTVAYALAFAHAAEAALDIKISPRAAWLRALMAELERLANHFGDFGAICNDASFAIMHAHCGVLRERTLRAAAAAFGHRLMMDCVVPGGVAADLAPEGAEQIRDLLAEIGRHFPKLVTLYDNTASLQDRTVSTGILKAALARQFGAGGYVGRASGRAFDARRVIAYPPYDTLKFDVPVLDGGDVNARVWIRIREIEQSVGLIKQILAALPGGPLRVGVGTVAVGGREGLGFAEGFRGDVLAWL